MKFIVKNNFKESIASLMRKVGYRLQGKNEERKEFIFIRPLGRGGYPRFHIYLRTSEQAQQIFLNLHLDQKKPSYKGAPAHSADYEGEVVENEAKRIKQVLQKENNCNQ